MSTKTRLTIIFVGGLFLLLDQFLKYLSLNNWTDALLWHKFFGWQPFLNQGAAFGLPFPSYLIIIFTIPIIFFIVFILSREKSWIPFTGYTFIFFGAVSNLIDRIYSGAVVDYWQILTGIINLADVMIVGGLMLVIINLRELKKLG